MGARKLIDILRTMPADQTVSLEISAGNNDPQGRQEPFHAADPAGRGLPAGAGGAQLRPGFQRAARRRLKHLLDQVAYAMAVHDIRYYLNGILFVAEGNSSALVATDGHRLAFCSAMPLDVEVLAGSHPAAQDRAGTAAPAERRPTVHWQRMIAVAANQAKFSFGGMEFVTKLVEGKFPDYNRVIPATTSNSVLAARRLLASLQRTAILTTDKFRACA